MSDESASTNASEEPDKQIAVKEESCDCACPKAEETRQEETASQSQQPSASSTSDDLKCPICHDKLRNPVGTPECCDHIFCLRCIRTWAKNTNRCPLDRLKFDLIFARKSASSHKVVRRIPVRDCDLVVDNITFTPSEAAVIFHDEDDDYCQTCGQSSDPALLLLCDSCSLAYHTYCLVPALHGVPEGDWFCPVCQPGLTDSNGSQLSLASTSTAAGASSSRRTNSRQRRQSLPRSSSTRRRRTASLGRSSSVPSSERDQIREIAEQVGRLLGLAAENASDDEDDAASSAGSEASGVLYSLPSIIRRHIVRRRKTKKLRRRRGRRFRGKRARRSCRTVGGRAGRQPSSSAAAAAAAALASRARLITRLGIIGIPAGRNIPSVKLPQSINPLRSPVRGRVAVSVGGGASSVLTTQATELSLFGNDYQLPSCDEDEEAGPFASRNHRATAVRAVVAPPEPTNFLSGLIESQAFLHLPASRLHIAPDGRLKQGEVRRGGAFPSLPTVHAAPHRDLPSSHHRHQSHPAILTCGVSGGASSGATGVPQRENEQPTGGSGALYDPFHPTSEDSAMSMSPVQQAAGGENAGGGGGGDATSNGLSSSSQNQTKLTLKSQIKPKKAADAFKGSDSESDRDGSSKKHAGKSEKHESNGGHNSKKKRNHSPQSGDRRRDHRQLSVELSSDETLATGISPAIDFSTHEINRSEQRKGGDRDDRHSRRSPPGSKHRRNDSVSPHGHRHHDKHHRHRRRESEEKSSISSSKKTSNRRSRSRSRSNSNRRPAAAGATASSSHSANRHNQWRSSDNASPSRSRNKTSRRSRSRTKSRSRSRSRSKHDRERDRGDRQSSKHDSHRRRSPSPAANRQQSPDRKRNSRPEHRPDNNRQTHNRQNSEDKRRSSRERDRSKDSNTLQSPSGRRDPFALLSAEADAKVNAIRSASQQVLPSDQLQQQQQNVPPTASQLQQIQTMISGGAGANLIFLPHEVDPHVAQNAAAASLAAAAGGHQIPLIANAALPTAMPDMFSAPPPGWPLAPHHHQAMMSIPPPFVPNFPPPPLPGDNSSSNHHHQLQHHQQQWMQQQAEAQLRPPNQATLQQVPVNAAAIGNAPLPPPPPPPPAAAASSSSASSSSTSQLSAAASSNNNNSNKQLPAPTPQSILQSLAALGAIINKKTTSSSSQAAPPPPPPHGSGKQSSSKSSNHHGASLPPPPPPPPPKKSSADDQHNKHRASGRKDPIPASTAPIAINEDSVISTSNSSEDVPSSAVELQNKQAKKAGKQMLTEIEECVKKIVKPVYVSGKLDKDGYKEVMKKCVTKIFAKRPKRIHEDKIKDFVDVYLQRAMSDCVLRKKRHHPHHQHHHHSQQHNRPESASSSSDTPVNQQQTQLFPPPLPLPPALRQQKSTSSDPSSSRPQLTDPPPL